MRSEEEARRAIGLYGDTVRRICMVHLKNYADTEDVFQTVFLKYVLHSVPFDSDEHEKAWIIRVTINACRDLLKSFFHSRTVPLDSLIEKPGEIPEDHREILERSFHCRPNTRTPYICIISKDILLPRSQVFLRKM